MRDCNERRAEIMRILIARRSETQATLAAELGVSVSTVYRDIVRLTVDYPLETQRGNGGCVKVADWYHPHRNILSNEQQDVLSDLLGVCDAHQANVLRQMLNEYGSTRNRLSCRCANSLHCNLVYGFGLNSCKRYLKLDSPNARALPLDEKRRFWTRDRFR